MTALLRLLGLRGILALALATVAFALLLRVENLTTSRDLAQSRLATAEQDLAAAEANSARLARDLATTREVLVDERDCAVAAERLAGRLREQIARDAGTDRDAPTAPVLEDTIRSLQERSSFSDGQSPSPTRTSASPSILEDVFVVPLARKSFEWTITVIVAGKVELIASVADQAACLLAVAAVVEEIKGRREFEKELTGKVLVVCREGKQVDA